MWVNIDTTVNFQFGLLQLQIMKISEGEMVLNQLIEDKFLISKNRKAFLKICTDILIEVSLERGEKK